MPIDLPFFRSGSSLIRDKQDKLQRSAAVNEHARMEVGRLDKEKAELDQSEKRVHSLEKRHSMNTDEIDRRQRQISELDKEAERLREKMGEAENASSRSADHKPDGVSSKPPHPSSATSEYARKLEHVERLRKIQASEIQSLDDQNRALDIHIQNAKT